MSIVANRTFVHAILYFVGGDTTQIPKFRKLHNDGVFTYPEFCAIADSIIGAGQDDAITMGSGHWREQYEALNAKWNEEAEKVDSKNGKEADYEAGLSEGWDAAHDALTDLFDSRYPVVLEECGESELAHLFREHREAYDALVNTGDLSLVNDPNVLREGTVYGDDQRTLIAARFDSVGRITHYCQ